MFGKEELRDLHRLILRRRKKERLKREVRRRKERWMEDEKVKGTRMGEKYKNEEENAKKRKGGGAGENKKMKKGGKVRRRKVFRKSRSRPIEPKRRRQNMTRASPLDLKLQQMNDNIQKSRWNQWRLGYSSSHWLGGRMVSPRNSEIYQRFPRTPPIPKFHH